MIVGLTGGIGSGKSTVLSMFAEKKNVCTYIADERAKWLMQNSNKIKQKLIDAFGIESYKNNQLNKEFISKIVFEDTSKLKIINSIVHPEVKNDFIEFANKNSNHIIIYESAILFEARSNKNCDFIISVSAPLKDRIERVISRDNASKENVLSRVKNQLLETQRNLQSNYVIFNNSIKETELQVDKIYNILTEKAQFI